MNDLFRMSSDLSPALTALSFPKASGLSCPLKVRVFYFYQMLWISRVEGQILSWSTES